MTRDNPANLEETRKSTDLLVEGVLLTAYRDTVVLPNGGESVREWVKHPGASAVVPLYPDGTTVLLRQFRYPPRRTFIEVPAGKLDVEGEDPLAVAHRELEEEAGLKAGRMSPLGRTFPCIGYSDEVIYFYVAEDLTETGAHSEEDEFVEPFRLPFAEAVAMARRGDLLDAKSEIAILRAATFLDERAEAGTSP